MTNKPLPPGSVYASLSNAQQQRSGPLPTPAQKNKFQNIAFPSVAKTLIAKIVNINEVTGEMTLQYMTGTATPDTFTVPFTSPFSGSLGQHFMGGMYDIDDLVIVDVVTRGNRTSYRLISQGIVHNYKNNYEQGYYQQLRAGEKLVQGKGGSFTYWDQEGNFHVESGFRQSAQEQRARISIDSQELTHNPNIVYVRDYLRLMNNETAENNTSLRTFQSIVNNTLVQWGLANIISEHGNIRQITRIDDRETLFRVLTLDDDRKQEKSTLFLGFGFKQNTDPMIVYHTSEQAIGGFRFFDTNAVKYYTEPGLVWGQKGSFELTDGFKNVFKSNNLITELHAERTLVIGAGAGAFLTVLGEYQEAATSKEERYQNLSRFVFNDYTELINAKHKILRNNSFQDQLNLAANPGANYSWEVLLSPVSKFVMDGTKIAFGQTTSFSNITLTETEGKLGQDTNIGQIIYDATKTHIGGTGSDVKITFDATKNSIQHTIANEINGLTNYFGTNFGGELTQPLITQPMVKGTTLVTILGDMLTALTTLFGILGTHFHIVTSPGAGIPVPSAPSVELGIAAVAANTALGTVAGQVSTVISFKNFTE